MNCDHYQDLLLDHLYGLLDPAETAGLVDHLKVCPPCQAALEEARRQQGLFARAARVARTVPAFTAPDEEAPIAAETLVATASTTKPAVRALPRRRRSLWAVPWAAAAAVLLAAGLGFSWYQQGMTQQQDALASARAQVAKLDARINQVRASYLLERDRLAKETTQGVLHLQAWGPATYNAEAPGQVRVITQDAGGKPEAATLTARLLDEEKKVVHWQTLPSNGEVIVRLPQGLKPGKDLALELEAKNERAAARVQEPLAVAAPVHVNHTALNKTTFQVGDIAFFRNLTVEKFSLKPPEQRLGLNFTLRDPSGNIVRQVPMQTDKAGITDGQLALTDDLPGGNYTLEVTGQEPTAVVPNKRRLELVREQAPQIEFDRQVYKAKEIANIVVRGRRDENGAAINPNQPVTVGIQIDGKPVAVPGNPPAGPVQLQADDQGNAYVQVPLPQKIEKGQATVIVQFPDGKKDEKVVQDLPVVGGPLTVDCFPEGGDLVAGVSNRVYYRVRTAQGDPVDPEGHVILLSSQDVLYDSPPGQGAGIFTFVPDPKETYTLRVTGSEGVTELANPFKNPIVRDGVVLSSPDSVTRENDPLKVTLRNAGADRTLLLLATCRGRVVDQRFVQAQAGTSEVVLDPVQGANGVVKVTLYEPRGQEMVPLAERLVFRQPAERLQVGANPDKKTYRAGDHVRLDLWAKDEKGANCQAYFLAQALDDRAWAQRDGRDKSPGAHFYLASDVQGGEDLEDADFLLKDTSEARQALDLYLGTQGWRRFVRNLEPSLLAMNRNQYQDQQKAEATVSPGLFFNCESSNLPAPDAKSKGSNQETLADLRRRAEQEQAELACTRSGEAARVIALSQGLTEYQERPREWLRLGLGLFALALVAVAAGALLVGIVRGLRRQSPTSAWGMACLSLVTCVVLYLAANTLHPQDPVRENPPVANLSERALPPLPEDLPVKFATPETSAAWALGVPKGVFADRLLPAQPQDPTASQVESRQGQNLVQNYIGVNRSKAPSADLLALQNNYGNYSFGNNTAPSNLFRQEQARGDFSKNRWAPPESQKILFEKLAKIQRPQGQAGPGGKAIPAMSGAKSPGQVTPAPTVPSMVAPPAAKMMLAKKDAPAEAKGTLPGLGGFTREFIYRQDRRKKDYADTLLWSPALEAPNGQRLIAFDLPRQAGGCRVLLYGHTASGRFGSWEVELPVQQE